MKKSGIFILLALAILALASFGCGTPVTRYTVSADGSVKTEHIPSFDIGIPMGSNRVLDEPEIVAPEGMTREEAKRIIEADKKSKAEERADEEESLGGGGGGGGGC